MITLPSWVAPSTVKPRFLDQGTFNRNATGTAVSRTDRPGNKFAVDITIPPVNSNEQGAELLACLIRGKTEGVRFRWERVGNKYTAAETEASFSLSGTLGMEAGLNASATRVNIKKGTFFSFEQSGRSYLHFVDEDLFTGSANVIKIFPELRTPTVSGTDLNFTSPVIDGFIEGSELAWEMAVDKYLDISFTLEERW